LNDGDTGCDAIVQVVKRKWERLWESNCEVLLLSRSLRNDTFKYSRKKLTLI